VKTSDIFERELAGGVISLSDPQYPKIAALKARLAADPAVRFAEALEAGETVAGTGVLKGHVPLADLLERVPA
jgi:glutathione S-transferase